MSEFSELLYTFLLDFQYIFRFGFPWWEFNKVLLPYLWWTHMTHLSMTLHFWKKHLFQKAILINFFELSLYRSNCRLHPFWCLRPVYITHTVSRTRAHTMVFIALTPRRNVVKWDVLSTKIQWLDSESLRFTWFWSQLCLKVPEV